MSFTIYDVSLLDEKEITLLQDDNSFLDDDDKVEMGLSSGELRQSLMDRFREDLKNEDSINFVNASFIRYDFSVNEDFFNDPVGRQSVLEDIENVLYELEDEDFINSTWFFTNEVVHVVDE